MKLRVSCAICNKSVDKLRAEIVDYTDGWIITAFCHDAADSCFISREFVNEWEPTEGLKGVAFNGSYLETIQVRPVPNLR